MTEKFNLVTEPWIKVLNQQGELKTISLQTLFQEAQNYQRLAGEMQAQDLAILRFLLAIVTTVYSRFDSNDEPYEWLELGQKMLVKNVDTEDFDSEDKYDDMLASWHDIYDSGKFSAAIDNYLKVNMDKFDFLGDEPFYQVNRKIYDRQVATNKKVDLKKQKGTVSVKQINRTISESNNSPDIFSPKSEALKNKLQLDQLVRWIIAYQSFTGVTDKTKVVSDEKFSVSPGWLYSLNPVYAEGKNLFETLMLNYRIDGNEDSEYKIQKPFWEFENINQYIDFLKGTVNVPTLSISTLYTLWSRMLHIEWINYDPIIFSAGLPKLDNTQAFNEPMTTWHKDKKTSERYPEVVRLSNLSKAMWRNFGQYISTTDKSDDEPGIINWFKKISDHKFLPADTSLVLKTTNLVSDGNATSQSPVAESVDSFKIRANVLFDKKGALYWPKNIESMIDITQIIGKDFWILANNLAKLRGLDGSSEFANRLTDVFYESLNAPFLSWLSNLRVDDSRNKKKKLWKKTLQQIAFAQGEQILHRAAPRDIIGITNDDKVENIFIIFNRYKINVSRHINL